MKTKLIKTIILIGITILAYFSCGVGKEEKNSRETDGLTEFLIATENYYYKYNCPAYTLLDAGTTTVHLNQGEEFWFDFKPRQRGSIYSRTYSIRIQESFGQDVKFSVRDCFVNHVLTDPKSILTMNPNFSPDSGLTGQLEVFNEDYFGGEPGNMITTIKSVSGSGNVNIIIPNSSN
ncbi:hypothetical protein EHQ76_08695 [Leptospira barantonii]|uniref:Uncharacterized protein n=1 Tax=Leptospira barantonii TaxID=2023184 RepID=A0A5F2BDR9_9LEPT|nr:hypothetical protein [Leptospira barantonii]TGM03714.1 hypothetical protein EHQ76_08695 [Leptospira barantonii]